MRRGTTLLSKNDANYNLWDCRNQWRRQGAEGQPGPAPRYKPLCPGVSVIVSRGHTDKCGICRLLSVWIRTDKANTATLLSV